MEWKEGYKKIWDSDSFDFEELYFELEQFIQELLDKQWAEIVGELIILRDNCMIASNINEDLFAQNFNKLSDYINKLKGGE